MGKKMWCLVSQPKINENAVMVVEVRVRHKATGQECLNQVCQKLGIIEMDYFGLQYKGPKNEDIWLNLRNEIRQEISNHPPPYRFQLRVKFWVPPHIVLQESARHQFYLQARIELLESRVVVKDVETAIRIAALAAQAETGDEASKPLQKEFYAHCLGGLPWNTDAEIPNARPPSPSHGRGKSPSFLPPHITKDEWMSHVTQHHQTLKCMQSSVAEYWMLKEVSTLQGYGTETFSARWIGPGFNVSALVTTSPQSVVVSSVENDQKLIVPFSVIHAVANNVRCFILKYITDAGVQESVTLKLETFQASISLYRSITEKHAFYSCETVRSAVMSQFVRDLKGTIASFFNENTDLGKKYVFDIQRTCREVYDNARRILYQSGGSPLAVLPCPCPTSGEQAESISCGNSSCTAVREHLRQIQEALLCRICMDNDIEVVFCPCGHALACLPCAQRCTQCPVCRASISHTQTIFLPLIGVARETHSENGKGFSYDIPTLVESSISQN